ncbi:MAG: hypothetical protein IJ506_03160 [Clostridia bacterium]|nr:hypothetical protein [Clostridia bacterium]
MKKKSKFILTFGAIAGLCLGLSACDDLTKLQSYEAKGYVVSVTYDANGGVFNYDKAISITDLYKPADYEADINGTVQIKLTQPENPVREEAGSEEIVVMKEDRFLTGWYQTRELKLVNGYPVDEKGNLLYEYDAEEGIYYYVLAGEDGKPVESVRTKTEKNKKTGEEKYFDAEGYILLKKKDGKYLRLGKIDEDKKVIEGIMMEGGYAEQGIPAYTYSGRWDFETDTLSYNEQDGKKKSLTLYAGWSEYFEMHYYYKVQGQESDWIEHSEYHKFAYNVEDTDLDTLLLPQWQNGKMTHLGDNYIFPSVAGSTFLAAYTDPECQNEIKASFEHQGTIDQDTGKVVNRVQNIYFVVEPVKRYKIETAKQFTQNVSLNGYYEILNDLDFAGLAWPSNFMTGTFTGQIYAAGDQPIKFSNISVTYDKDEKTEGGLFGKIADSAVLTNLTFENVKFDLQKISTDAETKAYYGLFAGFIDEGVTLTNVSVSGAFLIGNIGERSDENFSINLLANGEKATALSESLSNISLLLYGVEDEILIKDPETGKTHYENCYAYAIDPEDENSVQVDTTTGNIKLTLKESKNQAYQPSYDIIKIETGGNQQ